VKRTAAPVGEPVRALPGEQESWQHPHAEAARAAQGDQKAADKAAAHKGLIARPWAPRPLRCASCHAEGDGRRQDEPALHGAWFRELPKTAWHIAGPTSSPFPAGLPDRQPVAATATSARPRAKGGLMDGHMFARSRPWNSLRHLPRRPRGSGYTGKSKGVPADVHWEKGKWTALACHRRPR